jgi:hypothetical protein
MNAQSLETSVISLMDSRRASCHATNSPVTRRAVRTSLLRHRSACRGALVVIDHEGASQFLRDIGDVTRRGVK